MKENSLHNIWIVTENGLSRYDIKVDSFTNFNTVIDSVDALKRIIPIWATKEDIYCIESESWTIANNVHTPKRRRLVKIPQAPLLNLGPYSVYCVASNSVWMLLVKNEDLMQISLASGNAAEYLRNDSTSNQAISRQLSAEAMRFDRTQKLFMDQ